MRTMPTSGVHRARVAQADLDPVGSATIDEDLLDAAGLLLQQRSDRGVPVR